MRTALVTVAHGRHDHLELQRQMLSRSQQPVDDYIVVALDDEALATHWAQRDDVIVLTHGPGRHGLPIAAARNAGAAEAVSRGAELIIFLDVDCLPDPALVGHYQLAASDEPALLCGPVAYLPRPGASGYDLDGLHRYPFHPARPAPQPGQVQQNGDPRLFWSLSFAVTRETWLRTTGFCPDYEGYGAEDTDFAFVARDAGASVTWVGGAAAYHQWHPTQSPPVGHLEDIVRNAAIFARRWGWWPMEGWLGAFAEQGLVRWDAARARYVTAAPAVVRQGSPS
ncbi:MAG TPA: galactosyltransferase-related protein [Propionibacteriaceae bacterium]